jgi:hypothetical protein
MTNEDKRYQVFISSTFNDLKAERAEVTQALLELDCIPCGMEAFPAANETQWSWIKKIIEECDYYVLIIGGKYGTINEETGLSYTEMEYDYANEQGIPTIAFIVEDEGKMLGDKLENVQDRKDKLKLFKERVKKNLCKFYTTPEDLGGKVSRSITQLKKTTPRTGWIRADSQNNYPSKDIIRLMKENEKLNKELEKLNAEKQKNEVQKSIESTKIELPDADYKFSFTWDYYDEDRNVIKDSECTYTMSWKEIYKIIVVPMINNAPKLEDGEDPISEYIYEKENESYRKKKNLPLENSDEDDCQLEGCIDYSCLMIILIRFKKLGYIDKQRNSWVLTEKGLDYFAEITL